MPILKKAPPGFYKRTFLLTLPILAQNLITSLVAVADNMMVGQLGTAAMSAASICNEIFFIFNLAVFGTISGAEIYGAQFYGSKNWKGMRHAFWFKIYACLLLFGLMCFLVSTKDVWMISFWLHEGEDPRILQQVLEHARLYMKILLVSLLPWSISMSLSSSCKESGQTLPGMEAGLAAVGFNLLFNYLLIFGRFGFPALGIQGAALATAGSRFVELAWLVFWCLRHKQAVPYLHNLLDGLSIPLLLAKNMVRKAIPLLCNEFLWSFGLAFVSTCYASRGIVVLAAMNISTTITNLAAVLFMAFGSAIAIMVGQRLGAGELELAVEEDNRLIWLSFFFSLLSGLLVYGFSFFLPELYNVEAEVRLLARTLLQAVSGLLWIRALAHAGYFTIRSGGKTLLTFLMDSGLSWLLINPLAWYLCCLTSLDIVVVFILVQCAELIKVVLSLSLVRSQIWVHNLTSKIQSA